MNADKPGWQTSEFWIALASQLLALLVLAGVLSPADRGTLEAAVSNSIAAVFTIVASASVVIQYIAARTSLKRGRQGGSALAPLVAAVLLFLWAGSASAQPAVAKTALLPWRDRIERRLEQQAQRQQDLALQQLQGQIAALQAQIAALNAQRPVPAPPPVIVLGPPQQVPLGAAPYQQIPLGGPPRQDVPLGGPPKQDVPLGGPPRQDVPLGPPPRQDIPLGQPKPLAPPPGEVKPAAQRYVPAVARR